MIRIVMALASACLVLLAARATSQTADAARAPFDPDLARTLGADERGMRGYVLVILKTGPIKVPAGPERDEMFKGHFANIERLSAEGKLVVAGPLDGVEGRRGIFIFTGSDLDEVRRQVATDPVIVKGEMTAEFHKFYGSAALMQVKDTHERIVRKR